MYVDILRIVDEHLRKRNRNLKFATNCTMKAVHVSTNEVSPCHGAANRILILLIHLLICTF